MRGGAHVYLQHILSEYDRLSEFTFFLKISEWPNIGDTVRGVLSGSQDAYHILSAVRVKYVKVESALVRPFAG